MKLARSRFKLNIASFKFYFSLARGRVVSAAGLRRLSNQLSNSPLRAPARADARSGIVNQPSIFAPDSSTTFFHFRDSLAI